MKKTYIIPQLEVIKIITQQILAASTRIGLHSTEEIDDEDDLL